MDNEPTEVVVEARPDKKRQLQCDYCGGGRWHSVLALARMIVATDTAELIEEHEIVLCDGCRNASFRKCWSVGNIGEPSVVIEESLYPERADVKARRPMTRVNLLPQKVRECYLETLAALNRGGVILAGVGIRVLIESVCKHKRIKGGTLKRRIDALESAGLLGKVETRVLHRLRFLGNKAAHEAKPATREELSAGIEIAEHLLSTVYVLRVTARKLPARGR